MSEYDAFELCKEGSIYINKDSLRLFQYLIEADMIPIDALYVSKDNTYIQKQLATRKRIYDSINKKEYKNPDGTYKEEYDFLNYIVYMPNIYNVTPFYNTEYYNDKYDKYYKNLAETSRYANLNEIIESKINFSNVNPILRNQLKWVPFIDNVVYDNYPIFKEFSIPATKSADNRGGYWDININLCCWIDNIRINNREEFFSKHGLKDEKLRDYLFKTMTTDFENGYKYQKSTYDGFRAGTAHGALIDIYKFVKAKKHKPQIIADLDTKYTTPEMALESYKKSEMHKTLVKLNKYFGCIGAIATFHTVASKKEEDFYRSEELFNLAYGDPLKLATIDNKTYKDLIDEADNCCQKYIFNEKNLKLDDAEKFNAKKVTCSPIDSAKHKNMIKDLAKKVNSKDYYIK